VEIHKSVCCPKFLLQVLATYHFACVLDERGQELKRLLLDSDLHPVLSKFTRVEVNFKNAKAKTPVLRIVSEHESNRIERECITRARWNKAQGRMRAKSRV